MRPRFDRLVKLGEGGMGAVYEAHDRTRDMRVALKVLQRLDATALYRFKREFRSLADVSHPNIINLYELIAEGDEWFYTMELIRGGDLISYVRSTRPDSDGADDTSGMPSTIGADPPPLAGTDTLVALGSADWSASQAMPITETPEDSSDQRMPLTARVHLRRLASAFAQVASALDALHGRGLVHRDLKPSNVLVTRQGRAVLMDFGIVAENREFVTALAERVGTPHFMAPEQIQGQPVTAAADWYGFGVLLYLALAGRLPYPGSGRQVMTDKQTRDPVPPRTFTEGIPPALEQLCGRLLARRPEDRPGFAEVWRTLGRRAESDPRFDAGITTDTTVFVGRDLELAELERAFEDARRGQATAVFVRGPSGIGKSFLVRQFLRSLEDADTAAIAQLRPPLILVGRCYERETLSYKAFDGVVDNLSLWLSAQAEAVVSALWTPQVAQASRLFPVLRRARGATEVPAEPLPPREQWSQAINGLRSLLGKLAVRRPLVLFIDDLQWADADSAKLLIDLLRAPAPPLLFIAATRIDETGAMVDGPAASRLQRTIESLQIQLPCRRVSLGPLSPSEQRELVDQVHPHQGQDSDCSAYWRQSEGNPLLLSELARYARDAPDELGAGPPTLAGVLGRRIERLTGGARDLLEAVCVAGEPAPLTVLADAAGVLGDDRERAAAALRTSHLVRVTRSQPESWLDIYHGRVREAVAAGMSDGRRRALHRALARAFEREQRGAVDILARHWLEGGDRERAVSYLESAASSASSKLAFDRAAALYGLVLELQPGQAESRRDLLERLGDALALAGHHYQAASAFDRAAELAPADAAVQLQQRAADCVLRSGRVAEGLVRIDAVFGRLGASFARSRRRAIVATLLDRTRLALRGGRRFRPRPEKDLSLQIRARLDSLGAITHALGLLDPVRGTAAQCRFLLEALRAGEEQRICRALAGEMLLHMVSGGRGIDRAVQLSDEIELRARRLDDPTTLGVVHMAQTLVYLLGGRFRQSAAAFELGERILRVHAGAEWERVMGRYYACMAHINLGDLRRAAELLEGAIEDAERRDDVFAHNFFRAQPYTWCRIREDRPDEAHRGLELALAGWPETPFLQAHHQVNVARAGVLLYESNGDGAWEVLQQASRGMRQILVHRAKPVLGEVQVLMARAAVLRGDSRAATRLVRALERNPVPLFGPYADCLRAALEVRQGAGELAQRSLVRAIAGFDELGSAHMAAACRYQLGRALGGAQGADLILQARAWSGAQTVINPERMFAFNAPGFDD
jgi:eukaryotic-like serine/threonine-protein kinase